MKAIYFPHDSNAKDDPKISILIEEIGLEGYGIYWVLLELLREQPDYKYPIRGVPSIARRYITTVEKIKQVITNYDLFLIDDENFFSVSLIRRMGFMEEKTKKLSEAGKKGSANRWKSNSLLPGYNQAITTQWQIKEKKINENKINDNIQNVFSTSQCKVIAMKDDSWMRANKRPNEERLNEFNEYLTGQGKHELNPMEWKSYFYHWNKKNTKSDTIVKIKM